LAFLGSCLGACLGFCLGDTGLRGAAVAVYAVAVAVVAVAVGVDLFELSIRIDMAAVVLNDDAVEPGFALLGELAALVVVFCPDGRQIIEITTQAEHGAGTFEGLCFGSCPRNLR